MDIQNELHLRAKTRKNHQDKDVRVIHDCDLLDLATNHGLTPRQVFTQSLKTGIFPLRYLRNADSIVQDDQIVLAESCVAVVGAGGLGGHTIEYLARLARLFHESSLPQMRGAACEAVVNYCEYAATKQMR